MDSNIGFDYIAPPVSGQEVTESTLDRIIAERREKADALRGAGHNPYANDFRPTHTLAEIRARYDGSQPKEAGPGMVPVDGAVVRVAGRAMAKRGFGKTVFVPVADRDGSLQIFLNVDHLAKSDFETVLPQLDAGDWVGAEGTVFWTKRGEMSLLCTGFRILTKSLRPLPDKWKGLTDVELRYRMRYLDLASDPDVRNVFLLRTRLVRAIRNFLDARHFVEVETPMMHPIIGGAAAKPFATHHNALDMKLFMRIAPELYLKRLLVGGLDRVYEINRNFRNEGLSRQHNPEFTMLEFYQAYATYADLMDLTETMFHTLASEVVGRTTFTWWGQEISLAAGWQRLSVRDAVVNLGGQPAGIFDDPRKAANAALQAGVSPHDVFVALSEAVDEDAVRSVARRLGADSLALEFAKPAARGEIINALADCMLDELSQRVCAGHLGYFIFDVAVEDKLVQPTFLTEFPVAVSPLARRSASDPAVCDRFELFIGGKEIANAFSELNDPDDQRARFVAQLRAKQQGADETMDYDEDYCRALEVGMPPAAGEGVGIDRLTMLFAEQDSIRDVILFPVMRPE